MTLRKAPPPPLVPPRTHVVLGGREVRIEELRQRFSALQPFIEQTSFEDGDSVFPTQEEACRYVFRHSLERARSDLEALNADIERFNREFPEHNPDRITAFHALGSIIGHPDYVKLRLTVVDLGALAAKTSPDEDADQTR